MVPVGTGEQTSSVAFSRVTQSESFERENERRDKRRKYILILVNK